MNQMKKTLLHILAAFMIVPAANAQESIYPAKKQDAPVQLS